MVEHEGQLHQELIQINACTEHAVRHRKTLRALSLAKRFIPAYTTCTADLKDSSNRLLVTVICDKLHEMAHCLNEYEALESHGRLMKRHLTEQKEEAKEISSASSAAAKTAEGPLRRWKVQKVSLEFPRLPKLMDRQLAEVEANLARVEKEKTTMHATLDVMTTQLCSLTSLHGDDEEGAPFHHDEPWKQLFRVMETLKQRCRSKTKVSDDAEHHHHHHSAASGQAHVT